MIKTGKKPNIFKEADYRAMQEMLLAKGREFSVSYIRKVCEGDRNNDEILTTAKEYSKRVREFKAALIVN